MKKLLKDYFRTYGIILFLVLPFTAGCSWVNPGTVDDPGEAVGAPTMPEGIEEGFEEGSDYPEEDEVQSF